MSMFDYWTRKHAAPATPSQTRLAELPADMDALWSNMSHQFDVMSLQNARVSLLGFDARTRARLHEICIMLNVASCTEAADLQMLSEEPTGLGEGDVIVLNFDAFRDIGCAVDTLRKFRQRAPKVAVILVSSAVRGDDLGRERAPICDVTLRAPVTLPRLKEALRTSISNVGAGVEATLH